MKFVMEEVEKQRESNHELEKELSRLSSSQAKDSEVMQSNLLKKLNEQVTCIELLKEQLLCAEKLTSELEKKLSGYAEELEPVSGTSGKSQVSETGKLKDEKVYSHSRS
jgi:hypothetical protein